MSQHLSSNQILECLIGAADSDEERHARECAACRAALERIAKPLTWFRGSLQHAGERGMHYSFTTAPVLLLTPASLDRVWYSNIIGSIQDALHSREKRAGVTSVLVHVCVIALLFLIGTNKTVQRIVGDQVQLIAPDLAPYQSTAKKNRMAGGGGGGDRSSTPASKGKLPKLAQRQFVPPMISPVENPKLVMDPALIIQPDASIPRVNMDQLGDPLAKSGLASNGFGSGGGMGSGRGGGVGPGSGPGFGPGSGGGMGGGAYRVGGGVSPPTVLYKVEPEYSEEARQAKFQGTVLLFVVVDEHGNPRDIKILRPLGLGLDQKAIEAVSKWKFNPGKKDGKPVPVEARIEVNFRLL
jgi:TonB family protein